MSGGDFRIANNICKAINAAADVFHLSLVEKWSPADVNTSFSSSSFNFGGKFTQGAILFHIVQKGAIVQKRLKTHDPKHC